MSRNEEVVVIKGLGSRMLPYTEYGIKHLEMKSFNLNDVKYLNSKGLNYESVYKKLSEKCVNFDVMDLTFQDGLFALIYTTLFTDPKTEWIYPKKCKCGKEVSLKVTAQEFFEFKDIDLKVHTLPITAKIAGREFKFSPITVRQFCELDKLDKSLNLDMHLYALMTHEDPTEVYEFFMNNIKPQDGNLKILKRVGEVLDHGPLPKLTECVCGISHRFDMEQDVSKLTPFCHDEGDIDARIDFG